MGHKDFVDNAESLGFFWAHIEITVGLLANFVDRLSGMLRHDFGKSILSADDFLRRNLDVGGLSSSSS